MREQSLCQPLRLEPFGDLFLEDLGEHIKLGAAVLCGTAKSRPIINGAVGLGCGCDFACPLTIEADALFIAVLDTAGAMAPLTRFAVSQGPGLEAGFPEAFEEQPDLAQRTRLFRIPHAPPLLSQSLKHRAAAVSTAPSGQPVSGRGRQFARRANQTEALGHTPHLPTAPAGTCCSTKPSRSR